MWIIPLVWGWFAIGYHHGRRTEVSSTLRARTAHIILPGNAMVYPSDAMAIKIRGPEKRSIRAQTLDIYLARTPGPVSRGDNNRDLAFAESNELRDGPFYNYARCGTWSHVARTVIQAYVNSLHPSKDAEPMPVPVDHSGPDDASTNIDDTRSTHVHDPDSPLLPRPVYSRRASGDVRFSRALERCRIFDSGPVRSFAWKEDSERSSTGSWSRTIQGFSLAIVLQG